VQLEPLRFMFRLRLLFASMLVISLPSVAMATGQVDPARATGNIRKALSGLVGDTRSMGRADLMRALARRVPADQLALVSNVALFGAGTKRMTAQIEFVDGTSAELHIEGSDHHAPPRAAGGPTRPETYRIDRTARPLSESLTTSEHPAEAHRADAVARALRQFMNKRGLDSAEP
jgi:hypothetical protein